MNKQAIRSALNETRQSITARHAKMASHVERRNEPLPADFSEQAIEVVNEETIEQLSAQLALELQRVEAALAKLDADAYGTCERCGEVIESARLQALPATQYCLGCADL